MNSGVSTNSNSVSATRGDKATRSIQSSFHHEERGSQPNSPPQQLSPLQQAPGSNSSTPPDTVSDGTPMSHQATKRDKLVGKAGKVVAKLTRDPELRDRAMLLEIGGKEAAEGLTIVDSSAL
ncbi:hypothetical protein FRC06_004722 [Ceratobasidium sp. 370]|nr:hypothetical protein FRC06_004722 [Ceratobasidium sp. 370]